MDHPIDLLLASTHPLTVVRAFPDMWFFPADAVPGPMREMMACFAPKTVGKSLIGELLRLERFDLVDLLIAERPNMRVCFSSALMTEMRLLFIAIHARARRDRYSLSEPEFREKYKIQVPLGEDRLFFWKNFKCWQNGQPRGRTFMKLMTHHIDHSTVLDDMENINVLFNPPKELVKRADGEDIDSVQFVNKVMSTMPLEKLNAPITARTLKVDELGRVDGTFEVVTAPLMMILARHLGVHVNKNRCINVNIPAAIAALADRKCDFITCGAREFIENAKDESKYMTGAREMALKHMKL